MMNRSAEFSADRLYRHRLDRWWSPGPRVGWLMCNPSDAGEEKDDPTVRKTIGFTARWGFMGLTVINPFDLILTDSAQLPKAAAPVSARNVDVISQVAIDVELLVVAWGCESVMKRMVKRNFDPMWALRLIRGVNPALPIVCLGKSAGGCPYHPLMLAYATERIPFEVCPDVRVPKSNVKGACDA